MILITGASRGIGLEMVRYGIEQGWRIFACCRHPQQAETLLSLAKLANGRVSVHVADMYELATIQALSYELRNEAFDILGLPFGAKEEEIRAAHRTHCCRFSDLHRNMVCG